jgi:hypothetical protein
MAFNLVDVELTQIYHELSFCDSFSEFAEMINCPDAFLHFFHAVCWLLNEADCYHLEMDAMKENHLEDSAFFGRWNIIATSQSLQNLISHSSTPILPISKFLFLIASSYYSLALSSFNFIREVSNGLNQNPSLCLLPPHFALIIGVNF